MGNMCSKDMGFYMCLLLLYKAKIYATIYVNILQTGEKESERKQKPKLVESSSIHNKIFKTILAHCTNKDIKLDSHPFHENVYTLMKH